MVRIYIFYTENLYTVFSPHSYVTKNGYGERNKLLWSIWGVVLPKSQCEFYFYSKTTKCEIGISLLRRDLKFSRTVIF